MVTVSKKRAMMLLTALLLQGHPPAWSQSTQEGTELLVIGVVHSRNRNVNHHTMREVLDRYRPDLILWEQVEPFKPVFGLFAAHALRIARPPVEQLALQRFHKKNRTIPILGFDTLLPSRREWIRKHYARFYQFHDALDGAGMGGPDSAAYDLYASITNAFHDGYLSGTLAEMNRPECYRQEFLLDSLEDGNIRLGERHLPDSSLVSGYRVFVKADQARDAFMVRRILQLCTGEQWRRVVVLTGLAHKYYLMDELGHRAGASLRLRDWTD